jgi:hypothetical protein
MSRRHYASAIVSNPGIQFDYWMESLRNQHEGAVPKDHIHRIAKTVLRQCDPNQYLLSHATIVASVDCYAPKAVKTGRSLNRGVQIDVRWPDFRIKPDCFDIINNNGDAWERSQLLSTYRTFIGAHNYLEHIQLPELSKGFIVDAIARDLGKTCYIDILVATDRKHKQLIADILSGAISGLSMGCISLFTVCTRCGNVASDDAQLCPCVLYDGKGNKFIDDDGTTEVPIAELIGHVSVPNSNQFIEASWVRNPAFRGAVRRNILNPDQELVAAKLSEAKIVYELRKDAPEMDGIKKAASIRTLPVRKAQGLEDQFDAMMAQDGNSDDQEPGGQEPGGQGQQDTQKDQGPADTAPPKGAIDSLIEKAQEQLLETLVKNLGEKLAPKPEDVGSVSPDGAIAPNDNLIRGSEFDRLLNEKFPGQIRLIRWASKAWRIVHSGTSAIRRARLTPKDLVVLSWIEDRIHGRTYADNLYKVAMQVGPLNNFPSEMSYFASCKVYVGHDLTESERRFFAHKGRIASVANN